MKKYEFTEETKIIDGVTLHRIKALIDFSDDIKAGDIGGFIESESNLSHDGNAWVYDNACVYGNARVFNNARIACDASVYDDAFVCDNAKIYGNASVYGRAWISGDAWICGNARVYDVARICGNVWVYGKARICGATTISGDARICGDAKIFDNSDYATISGFGTRFRCTTFFRCSDEKIKVICGCFYGTIEEFREQVKNTRNGKIADEYLKIADLMEYHFDKDGENNE